MKHPRKRMSKKKHKHVRLYTDGGARGNPGPSGAGAVLKVMKDGEEETVDTLKKFLGETTNNQAEYRALILGLKRAKKLGAETVEAFLDSQLAVKQLNREYKVKDPELGKRFLEVWNLLQAFEGVTFKHIRREKNTEADALVNEAIDEHIG